jgi:pSer/pThr/pTyr-binding forkhead associated (FHA) protein
MDDVRSPAAAPIQGNPPADSNLPAGFVPLFLVLEPVGPRLEVHRPDVVVGRHSDAEVRLGFADISRRHCRLHFEDQHWRVYDLHSLNGVFVNGERMQEATLYPGDQLQLGTCVFLVEYALSLAAPEEENVVPGVAGRIGEQKRAS